MILIFVSNNIFFLVLDCGLRRRFIHIFELNKLKIKELKKLALCPIVGKFQLKIIEHEHWPHKK